MKENLVISNIKGGFGNQLFQYAAGYSFAQRLNAIYKVDLSFFSHPSYQSALKLNKLNIIIEEATEYEVEELKSIDQPKSYFGRTIKKLKVPSRFCKSTHYIDAPGFKHDSEFLKLSTPIYFEGWFLKPKYFDNFRNEFVNLFMPKFKRTKEILLSIEDIKKTNSVSIHIRRTDYINNPVFKVLELSYYHSAMQYITENYQNVNFYVFSDDIKWCQQNLPHSFNIHFTDIFHENNDLIDFYLMKNCKHNIIANSSFSWWAAYLNENINKQVIAPRVWFKDYFFQSSLNKNIEFLMDWKLI